MKDKLLSRNGFVLFRYRFGKRFYEKIPTKGSILVSTRVESNVGHPISGPSVTNNRRRKGIFLD